ncbi:MAG: aspartyl/glutamyl-tRNA amidotransferase subunit B [Actinobacteria bacterium 13_2_20CM_2_71_6]|nr:MAG: aspartyl/glutamyl-tRNA amidotransferase subunit B [Actinobacteria bacterium 13_2_20CM_2_71_6]
MTTYADVITDYEPVIGLETHVELGTRTKMFCGCPTEFGAEPNTQVCPVCLGLPGSLPVANKAAIEATIRIGLALNCSIASWCRFARKSYFCPDMPKNFQISQYDEPLCVDGWLDVNRAGIPLVEIVTKPIPGTGALAPVVARVYVTELRELVRGLGVSDVRMEQGSLRCDVNTSLNRPGELWGTRTETKNVNSLRSVERAVRAEILRQAAVLDAGGRIVQETRHFHEETGETTSGRSKETATDYRYFPEPDLVPLAPDAQWVAVLRAGLPESPRVRRDRLRDAWGLSEHDMQSIVNAGAVSLIEATVAAGTTPEAARKWWLGELSRVANESGADLGSLATPAQVAELQKLIDDGKLTDKLARTVLEGVVNGEGSPAEVIAARGLSVVSDTGALTAAVDEAIAANPDVAAKVREGKVAAAGVIVGAVMKATRGQADAKTVRDLVLSRLGA